MASMDAFGDWFFRTWKVYYQFLAGTALSRNIVSKDRSRTIWEHRNPAVVLPAWLSERLDTQRSQSSRRNVRICGLFAYNLGWNFPTLANWNDLLHSRQFFVRIPMAARHGFPCRCPSGPHANLHYHCHCDYNARPNIHFHPK
jgi:hypothetical protein